MNCVQHNSQHHIHSETCMKRLTVMHDACRIHEKCVCKMVPSEVFWMLIKLHIPSCLWVWFGGDGLFWLKSVVPDRLKQHGLKDTELIRRRFVKSLCLNHDILLLQSLFSAPLYNSLVFLLCIVFDVTQTTEKVQTNVYRNIHRCWNVTKLVYLLKYNFFYLLSYFHF